VNTATIYDIFVLKCIGVRCVSANEAHAALNSCREIIVDGEVSFQLFVYNFPVSYTTFSAFWLQRVNDDH